jgi:hypothetical protein
MSAVMTAPELCYYIQRACLYRPEMLEEKWVYGPDLGGRLEHCLLSTNSVPDSAMKALKGFQYVPFFGHCEQGIAHRSSLTMPSGVMV